MVETHLPPVVDSHPTRQNASTNAYYRVLDFLEGQPLGNEYWCPKNIFTTLNAIGYKIAESTVRGALKQLRSEGKVFCAEKGKFHLYASTRRFSDDFNYLFKNFGTRYATKDRYQIHGLNLQLKSESVGIPNFKNALPLGGLAWNERDQCVRDSWGFDGGVTTVQLYRELLEVQVNCSGCPLDLDRYIAWLARLDGWLLAKRWVRVQGHMLHWMVKQYGFNQDFLKVNVDNPGRAITLQGFTNWYYRVYDKILDDGTSVVRSEIHSKEEMEIPAMLSLASGSMAYVQVMNLAQGTVVQLDNAVGRIGDIERAMSRMAKNFERVTRELKELKHMQADGRLNFRRLSLKGKKDGEKNVGH